MPSLRAAAPLSYLLIPEEDRSARCTLSTDACAIDEQYFYVNGSIEIPVHGQSEPFSWGVWVSLSEASFDLWLESFDLPERSHIGPFFGWLNTVLPAYPDTASLKTMVHLRDNGLRPVIELEHTHHPLSLEQRNGMSAERLAQIYAQAFHGSDA